MRTGFPTIDGGWRPMRPVRGPLWALIVATTLAGCTNLGSNIGGPTAAVFNNAGRVVGQSGASQEHARIVAAYGGIYNNDDVERAGVLRLDHRPHPRYQARYDHPSHRPAPSLPPLPD